MNQLIHLIFVPTIVWTALIFLTAIPIGIDKIIIPYVPEVVNENLMTIAALIIYLLYAAYYLTLDFWPAVKTSDII